MHRILSFIVLLLISCSPADSSRSQSRVVRFEYGGNGDSIYSQIYGSVCTFYEGNKLVDTIPLENVTVKIEQTGKSVLTNEKGEFAIDIEKGEFNLSLSKAGYHR